MTGELVIERAEIPIRSIELQLVRVETVGCAEGFAKESMYCKRYWNCNLKYLAITLLILVTCCNIIRKS